jgi:hypothetical protein
MYYVEKFEGEAWKRVNFSDHRSRYYCDGVIDTMDNHYPCPPLRLVFDGYGPEKKNQHVVRETKGRGEVHTN